MRTAFNRIKILSLIIFLRLVYSLNKIFHLFSRSCCLDLGLYALSVLVKAALHALDSAIGANPQLLAYHPDQTFVVRY